MLELALSPRATATLLYRLAAPRLTPVAKAAKRHEKRMARLFLRAVRDAKQAVPMAELEQALQIPGTGSPLYTLQEVIDAFLEPTERRTDVTPYMRAAAEKQKTISDALKAAMTSGAKAEDLCVNVGSVWTNDVIGKKLEDIGRRLERLEFVETTKAEREFASLDIISTVLRNQQRANSNPALAEGTKFLYRPDSLKPGGISAAAQASVSGDVLKLEWVASLKPGQGKALIDEIIEWGVSQGATELHGTAKYGSLAYYEKTFGAKAVGDVHLFTDSQDFVFKLKGKSKK